MSWLWLLFASVAGAECTDGVTLDQVFDELESAHNGLIELEIDTFRSSSDKAFDLLPCLNEPLNGHMAAELHRLQGMRQAVGGDKVASAQAYGAARAIEPKYSFPDTLAPEGSPVVADYEMLPVDTGTFDDLDAPSEGSLLIDGRSKLQRPQHWPSIVQVVGAEGALKTTAYLWPNDEMVDYPLPEPEPTAEGDGQADSATDGTDDGEGQMGDGTPDPLPTDPPPGQGGHRAPLLAGTVVAGIAAGGLYGMSASSRAKWADPATSDADVEALRPKINSTAAGSTAAAAVALGLGVTTVFTW